MGKIRKAKSTRSTSKRAPLDQEIDEVKFAKSKNRNKIRLRTEEQQFVDSDLSRKILSAARQQQREFNSDEQHREFSNEDFPTLDEANKIRPTKHLTKLNLEAFSDDEDLEESETTSGPEESFYEDVVINEEDEKAIERFMNKNTEPRRTLGDIILEKIAEKQTEIDTHFSEAGSLLIQDIDPRVKQMYEGVRDVLRKYRSGKLPKAFKIIPTLRNWEQILYITDPPTWSAAAMYQATRIFASNLKENMAQRFYNLVLLPRIRDDLAEYKRLNFHLYQAVRKSLFKSGAFMKGFLLPLLESGNCTLREAIIVGSVVARNSIPILHSSAAILKIAEMDYTGANSIVLRIFFDKKYALPYRVVDAVVFHFLRFERDARELPVLWHQALLTFVQRYKADVSGEQRDVLLGLLKKQSHATITPEIRRELQNARCRDLEVNHPEPAMQFD